MSLLYDPCGGSSSRVRGFGLTTLAAGDDDASALLDDLCGRVMAAAESTFGDLAPRLGDGGGSDADDADAAATAAAAAAAGGELTVAGKNVYSLLTHM